MPAEVFVLGLDEFNLSMLQRTPSLVDCRFHQLLPVDELRDGPDIPLLDLLARARRRLDAFVTSGGVVDAIVGYWDFPVSSMVPILSAELGLRSASLEAVVKCEHKYWSRLEQQRVIDEHPRFVLIDLDQDVRPPLDFPFWLKPVKSFSSELAFLITGEADFWRAMTALREGVPRMGRPFEYVLDHLDLPPEIAAVGGQAALAEESVDGAQVTVKAYRNAGEVKVYGIVDSITYPGSPSFLRYQYPSKLPPRVCDRLTDLATRVVTQVDLDAVPFNIEFFWDESNDEVNLLEVNPRHSQSHAKLFEYVDGFPNHHCLIMLALGRDPALPHRQGRYRMAAKWFPRRFVDGVIRRSPSPEEVTRAEREVPGTSVKVIGHTGDRLSERPGQDSYSYEFVHIYAGGDDEEELTAKFERCLERLPFEFDDIDDGPADPVDAAGTSEGVADCGT